MCLRRLPRSPKRVAVSVQQLRNWPPGNHAGVVCYDSRCLAMPWLAERLGRRGALAVFFTLMMVFIALTFGKVFYLGATALPWFSCGLFFSGAGRRQLRSLYSLAARAISHGVPRQCLRFFHLVRPVWRGGHYLFGWNRSAALRIVGNAGGSDFDCLCNWAAF